MTEDNVTNDNRSQRTRSLSPTFVIGGIVVAMAGFAIGRAYPAHDYHQIGTSSYLFDTHTGKACAPFRDSQIAAEKAIAAKGDIFDQVAASVFDRERTAGIETDGICDDHAGIRLGDPAAVTGAG